MADPDREALFAGPYQAVVNRRNPDGSHRFARTDVERVLPAIWILNREVLEASSWPPERQAILTRFVMALDVDLSDSDPRTFAEAVERYFERTPPDWDLLAELQQCARRIATRRRAEDARRRAFLEPPQPRARPPQADPESSCGLIDVRRWRCEE